MDRGRVCTHSCWHATLVTTLVVAILLPIAAATESSSSSGMESGSSDSSSSSSTGLPGSGGYVPSDRSLILTVTLSFNLYYLTLPSNFTTVAFTDLLHGLALEAEPDRLIIDSCCNATQRVGSATVGTSLRLSVLPSYNDSAITPSEVLTSILHQFNARGGPLLEGDMTQHLNPAYIIIHSSGTIDDGQDSSTGLCCSATRTTSCHMATIMPITTILTIAHVAWSTLQRNGILTWH